MSACFINKTTANSCLRRSLQPFWGDYGGSRNRSRGRAGEGLSLRNCIGRSTELKEVVLLMYTTNDRITFLFFNIIIVWSPIAFVKRIYCHKLCFISVNQKIFPSLLLQQKQVELKNVPPIVLKNGFLK